MCVGEQGFPGKWDWNARAREADTEPYGRDRTAASILRSAEALKETFFFLFVLPSVRLSE